MSTDVHDIHNFVSSSQRRIQEEYERIQKRATEDPGTAGDQGEENWATLLKSWLPSYFQIVTKGRILTESNYASPQIDVIVLTPAYPKILLDKKLYLAGGVVAAFECKTTLKAKDITAALRTSAKLRQNLRKRLGTPYRELNSTLIYGLLAHSHCWKGKKSMPLQNIEKALWKSDSQFVRHPVEALDFLCVADLATWAVVKMNYRSPKHFDSKRMAKMYGGYASTGYVRHAIGQERQPDYFSPLGTLLAGLFSKLAWTFHDMRNLQEYFRQVNLLGSGQGWSRKWDNSVYSSKVLKRLRETKFSAGIFYDEWSNGIFT